MLQKSCANLLRRNQAFKASSNLVQQQARYAGGSSLPELSDKVTDFDLILVGGMNAAALTKHLQAHHVNYKMALVTPQKKSCIPTAYFPVLTQEIESYNYESSPTSMFIDKWSRSEITTVQRVDTDKKEVHLHNGKVLTYKALVLGPGLDQRIDLIDGLSSFDKMGIDDKCFSHTFEGGVRRAEQNQHHGYNHTHGDMLVYGPQFPHKGEGTTFYALYYNEHLRAGINNGRASAGARIQYFTPNKQIVPFPYANEVLLDECHKRKIEVHFGWELIKVHVDSIGQKIGTLKNVDSGEVIEHVFTSANVVPPSVPHSFLKDSGLTDESGFIDVNPYTLQHSRHEGIFAFGDAIRMNTTRTQTAAQAQLPIVKQNVMQYLDGEEINGIYDGTSYQVQELGVGQSTSFTHLHNFEPASNNHQVPHYGLFSKLHHFHYHTGEKKTTMKIVGADKNVGPPHFRYPQTHYPLEINDYLVQQNLSPEDVKSLGPEFTPKRHVEAGHH